MEFRRQVRVCWRFQEVIPGARTSRISLQGRGMPAVWQSPGSHGICVSRELLKSRTEQLQETLRQKVQSEDSWRDKVTPGALLWGVQFHKGHRKAGNDLPQCHVGGSHGITHSLVWK